MGHGSGGKDAKDDEDKARAERLRKAATKARTIATKQLGPYLDDVAKKSVPMSGDGMASGLFDSGTGTPAGGSGIWSGPYAEKCSTDLQNRQKKLHEMASALLADARRWEQEADRIDADAKAAGKFPAGHN